MELFNYFLVLVNRYIFIKSLGGLIMAFISIKPEDFGELFKSEDFKKIYECTSKDFQQLISLESFVELAASFNRGVNYYQVEFNTWLPNSNHYVWLDDQKEKAISVSFNEHQVIQSLYLRPFVTYPESDNHFTQNTYSMPIRGDWFVFWGGANEFINYHYVYENQRYAYDLVKVQGDSSYQNAPSQNENFYAFGKEITAPAKGKVIKIIDGMIDNTPGEMDDQNPAGNYVIIEHSSEEYSLLAHLKKNSIKVSVGELVEEGQFIGLCGNSGNSSEPHLHFQVTDSSDFRNGKSLRIQFKDGSEPIQGDRVSNVLEYKSTLDKGTR